MTVCIAAIANNGKNAVLVADKLITSKGLLPYQVDMAADKIIKINENVYVLYSGGLTDATVIIERAINNIGENKYVTEIANLVNQKHLEYLLEILTRHQLTTRGIKDLNEFYREYATRLDEKTKGSIDEVFTTHNLSSNPCFIVCGKEKDGTYRIYFLNTNPRLIPVLMTTGYSTIGSGSGYSSFSLIQSKYNKALSVKEVKEMLLKAKKEAENDRDVGDKEDTVILGEEEPKVSAPSPGIGSSSFGSTSFGGA